MLRSELWNATLMFLILSLCKEYVVDFYDAHKQKIYGDDSCPTLRRILEAGWRLKGKCMDCKLYYVPLQLVRVPLYTAPPMIVGM